MKETSRTVARRASARASESKTAKEVEERKEAIAGINMILLCRNHITPPQLCESDEEGREREREERGERRKRRRAEREDDRQNTHAGTIGRRVEEGWECECGAMGRWVRSNGEVIGAPGMCSPSTYHSCCCCRR